MPGLTVEACTAPLTALASSKEEVEWHPNSWRSKPVVQDIVYSDEGKLYQVLSKIKRLPGLVSSAEIERAREDFARGARGEVFFLHAGDCAEAFSECTEDHVCAQLRILLQMSLVISMGAKVPVVRVARIAGQYAKPRSKLTEVVGGREYPSFRGDSINGMDLGDRAPNPERLVAAYFHSSSTLNYLRARMPQKETLEAAVKDLDFEAASIVDDVLRLRAFEMQARIEDAVLSHVTTAAKDGASGAEPFARLQQAMGGSMVWTSHEALNLPLEEASIRADDCTGSTRHYNTSAHMLWIGERTRQIEGAHVELVRGLRNPIGCKVGPSMQPSELVELLHLLDPHFEDGRVTLITRLGVDNVERFLPALITAVQRSGHRPLWLCDPCHGNGKTTSTGVKTREYADILAEIEKSIAVHAALRSPLAGLHLELTGDAVTECTGGCIPLQEEELGTAYKSLCDPRLNAQQSLHLALLVCRRLQGDSLLARLRKIASPA